MSSSGSPSTGIGLGPNYKPLCKNNCLRHDLLFVLTALANTVAFAMPIVLRCKLPCPASFRLYIPKRGKTMVDVNIWFHPFTISTTIGLCFPVSLTTLKGGPLDLEPPRRPSPRQVPPKNENRESRLLIRGRCPVCRLLPSPIVYSMPRTSCWELG